MSELRKLSALMREGVKLDGVQMFMGWADFDDNGKLTRTCALTCAAVGAKPDLSLLDIVNEEVLEAYEDDKAMGYNTSLHQVFEEYSGEIDADKVHSILESAIGYDPNSAVFPYERLTPEAAEALVNLYGRATVGAAVIYLNDERKWTREQIADLLEQVGL